MGSSAHQAARSLDRLEQLTLRMSHVTDERISQLVGLGRLQELNLQDSAVGDVGLKHLESLPRVRMLTLPNKVTDWRGWSALRACEAGEGVYLSRGELPVPHGRVRAKAPLHAA